MLLRCPSGCWRTPWTSLGNNTGPFFGHHNPAHSSGADRQPISQALAGSKAACLSFTLGKGWPDAPMAEAHRKASSAEGWGNLPEILPTIHARQTLTVSAHIQMLFNLSLLQGFSAGVTGKKHHSGKLIVSLSSKSDSLLLHKS